MKKKTTITSKIAAIQVKMLHIQYRVKKISEDQQLLLDQSFQSNRDKIRKMRNATYNTIDMLITMEHIVGLINDIFKAEEIRGYFNKKHYEILNKSKKTAEKWKSVRNRVGGHLDIDSIIQFCEQHNYKGVFLSDDLETDLSILNVLMIESALNNARCSQDIFGRDLKLISDMPIFITKLNEDWNIANEIFTPITELIYKIGKIEKMSKTLPHQWRGIITDD